MRLESPLSLLPDDVRSEAYPSVASLYGAIRDALIQNAQAVGAAVKAGGKSNQVGDNIGFSTIVPSDDADCLDQMLAAMKAITSQGEGCPHMCCMREEPPKARNRTTPASPSSTTAASFSVPPLIPS